MLNKSNKNIYIASVVLVVLIVLYLFITGLSGGSGSNVKVDERESALRFFEVMVLDFGSNPARAVELTKAGAYSGGGVESFIVQGKTLVAHSKRLDLVGTDFSLLVDGSGVEYGKQVVEIGTSINVLDEVDYSFSNKLNEEEMPITTICTSTFSPHILCVSYDRGNEVRFLDDVDPEEIDG